MEEYSNVKIRRLQKDEKGLLRFNQGYCYMQKDEYAQAKGEFHNIKNGTSKYKNSACYFYSYCDYALGNYDEALKGFQAIEGQDEYKDFVPYYIAQIYYKNKDYDKLMPYCEKILARKSGTKSVRALSCIIRSSDLIAKIISAGLGLRAWLVML